MCLKRHLVGSRFGWPFFRRKERTKSHAAGYALTRSRLAAAALLAEGCPKKSWGAGNEAPHGGGVYWRYGQQQQGG